MFAATAAQDTALANTVKAFPAFLVATRVTVNHITRFATSAKPLIDELRPVAVQLNPTLQALDTLAPQLDTLFAKLQSATDPMAIQSLEAAIWEQWTMVPETEQRLLMMRGMSEMQQHELKTSVETFTRLIELAPDLSEAMFPLTAEVCRTWGADRPVDFGPMRMTV